jgi:hypothetical protein
MSIQPEHLAAMAVAAVTRIAQRDGMTGEAVTRAQLRIRMLYADVILSYGTPEALAAAALAGPVKALVSP